MVNRWSPGCNCCGATGECPECDTFISVVISGIGNACATCQTLAGTYVVRDYGDPWTNCAVYNNYLDALGEPQCDGFYVTGVGQPNAPGIFVRLSEVGGQVVCEIFLAVFYTDALGSPTTQSQHTSVFTATVDTCADLVGATFTLTDSYETGWGATPGDLCGMNSATVTLAA